MNQQEEHDLLYPKASGQSLPPQAGPDPLTIVGIVVLSVCIPFTWVEAFGRSFIGYSNSGIMGFIFLFSIFNFAFEATLLAMGPIRAEKDCGIYVRALRAITSTALIVSCIVELNTIGEISSIVRGLGTPVAGTILLGLAFIRIGQKTPF